MQFINNKLFKRKLRLSAVAPVIVAVYNSCLINTLMFLFFTPAALTDYSLCVWVKNVFLFIKNNAFFGFIRTVKGICILKINLIKTEHEH